MRALFITLAFIASSFAQVDEGKVSAIPFLSAKVTAPDIGEINAGTARDAAINFLDQSANIGDAVKVYVQLHHGITGNVSAATQTAAALDRLIAAASAQGVSTSDFQNKRIVFEGESTTAGMDGGSSPLLYNAWPERLARRSNWVASGIFINRSTGSQSIAEIASQYTTQVYPYRPGQSGITESWLMVMIGIKDAGSGRTASQMLSDVESYIATAKGHGFTTVVCTTMFSNSFTSPQKQIILDYNAALLLSDVPDFVVDAVAAIGQPDVAPENYTDSVHPNADGYDAIADAINAAITP